MTINRPSLSEAVRALGRALVYAGDAFTAGGLTAIGQTEGEVTAEEQESYNDLVLPELTGNAVHERDVYHDGALVTVPLIIGPKPDGSDAGTTVYDTIASVGDGAGGGYSSPQPVVTTNLLLIPESEVDADSGLATEDTDADTVHDAWVGGANNAPDHAIWIWRAVPQTKSIAFRRGEGGKVIVEVPFFGMFDDDRPEGHKIWTRGDPLAVNIDVEI